MKKPIIGVIPLIDEERDSYWMLPGYLDGIAAAGGLPIIFPPAEGRAELTQLAELCAGFLFTGGHDIAPEVYGQTRMPQCGVCAPVRDKMEAVLLEYALEADKPVLGICRGLQFLNAALGGTLYQDLPTQRPSGTCHRQQAPYDKAAHTVEVLRDTPLHVLLKKEHLAVNSCHHQGVWELSPRLQVMAQAPDGLVEAVCLPPSRFVWGVQWHPEFLFRVDPDSRAIFRAFADACRG